MRTIVTALAKARCSLERKERLVALTLAVSCLVCGPLSAQSSPTQSGLTLREAIVKTLAGDAQIARARWTIEESHGALKRAQSEFDPTLTTSATRQDGESTSALSSAADRITQYDVGLAQRIRAGITVAPQVRLQRSRESAPDQQSAYNVANMGVALTLPLLRGRGGGLLTAVEDAAHWAHQASTGSLEHQRAVSVLLAVQAYWRYAAATQRVEVLRAAESRARRLLEETQTLIEAQERPAADEIRVRANHASKRANRLAAEGALIEARGALALVMGVAQEQLETLPAPSTSLPVLSADTALPTPATASQLARARRWDLAAAHNQSAAAAALLAGAQSESRPRFDVSLGLDYRGVASGSPLTAFSAGQKLRTSVGFSFGLPLLNRSAAGLALQEQARSRKADIERQELARQISLDAATAANRLRAAAAQLSQAHEAIQLSEKDVQNEEARFRLGASTLFDSFFSQDALTSAALGEIDAQLSYAISLARIRFETATLFQSTNEGAPVDVDALLAWSTAAPSEGAALRSPSKAETSNALRAPSTSRS